jgi:hypothetical protein
MEGTFQWEEGAFPKEGISRGAEGISRQGEWAFPKGGGFLEEWKELFDEEKGHSPLEG